MKFLIIFLISFVVIYLFYLAFVILNKKKSDNVFKTNQASILINLSKLDVNKINKNAFLQALSISNSFILAFTFTFAISQFFNIFILNLLASFFIMIVLITVIYKFVGFIFKRGEK